MAKQGKRYIQRKAYLIYFILVLLSFYQNCPLGNWLGIYGEQPVLIISLLLLIYILVFKKHNFNQEEKLLLALGFYFVFVGFVGNIVYYMITNEMSIIGENIYSKWIKNIIIFFSYVAFVVCIIHYGKKLNRKLLFRPFYAVLIILAILCVIEYLQIPYGLSFLPSVNEYPYWRIRLLTKESSFTSMMILVVVALGLLYAFMYSKNPIHMGISIVCSIILIYFSRSKTVLAFIPLFAVLSLLSAFSKIRKKSIKVVIIVAVLIAIGSMIPVLITSLKDDIQNYTSFATRGYSLIVGFIIGIIFPFGVGGGIYIWAIQSFFKTFLEPLSFLNSGLNLTEIYSIINATEDTTVTIKSGVLQYNVYWGIIGTLVLCFLFYNMYKKLKHKKSFRYRKYVCTLFLISIIVVILIRDMTTDFWLIFSIVSLLGTPKNKQQRVPSKQIRETNVSPNDLIVPVKASN